MANQRRHAHNARTSRQLTPLTSRHGMLTAQTPDIDAAPATRFRYLRGHRTVLSMPFHRTSEYLRNQESRNTSRRVIDGQRHAAMKGGNHGGKNRPYGWRKDRIHLSKREAEHIRREIPRVLAGVRPITLAREWNERGIPTVTGSPWQAATIKNIFTGPRIAGYVVYRSEILYEHGREASPQCQRL